jgi:hypothetical protein
MYTELERKSGSSPGTLRLCVAVRCGADAEAILGAALALTLVSEPNAGEKAAARVLNASSTNPGLQFTSANATAKLASWKYRLPAAMRTVSLITG